MSSKRENAQTPKPDFIGSMIQFVDHRLRRSQLKRGEEEGTARMKRRLRLTDQALKVRADEQVRHKAAATLRNDG